MTLIRTYGTRLEADLASIWLRSEGITAAVVGVGRAIEGGTEGVRLLVPDDQVEAALEILTDR
jgi:putative signal transducing protein